jgi:hypothetical protein
MSQKGKAELNRTSSSKEIRSFTTLSDWEDWLAGNHRSSQERLHQPRRIGKLTK